MTTSSRQGNVRTCECVFNARYYIEAPSTPVPPGGFKGAEMTDVLVSGGELRKAARGIRKRSCFGLFWVVLLDSVSGHTVALQLVRTYIFTSKMTQNHGKTGCQVTIHVDESDEWFVERNCFGCATIVRDNMDRPKDSTFNQFLVQRNNN